MHLPSNFLITSCSLVNKIWYRIARTVLRDHGKCLAKISSRHAHQHIQLLEQFCLYLEHWGRVVPFNGLKIYNCVPFHPEWHPLDPESLVVYRNITQLIKMKHFEVGQAEMIEHLCPLQYTILAWILSGKGSQLESLNIENPLFLAELFNSETTVKLPKLETITIPDLLSDPPTDRIQQMLAAAPNLKRIMVLDVNMLNYLPPDKYSLLVKIPFHVKIPEQEQLFMKIVEARPKLVELLYIPPSVAIFDWDRNDDEDSVDPAVQQRSDKMLERVLQACHKTLETIRVSGLLNPLGGLSFPPLVNLTKLQTKKWWWAPTGNEKFWRDVSSIDFRRGMPALDEIEIEDTARQYLPNGWPDLMGEKVTTWPTSSSGPQVHHQFSSNAHKLTLKLINKNLNFMPITSIAPNVTLLELKLYHTSGFDVDIAPFSDIWRFWPQLVQLKVDVAADLPNRNYDADFCGIYEEEAEILRDKEETYLLNVHIVPVRPSVLAMNSTCKNVHYVSFIVYGRRSCFEHMFSTFLELRKLALEIDFRAWNDSTDGCPTFLSPVTQILAFRRMLQTVITLGGVVMLQEL